MSGIYSSSPSSSLTSSPASIAACLLRAARSLFFSNNLSNLFAALNTPFVPAEQAAQLGSLLYLFSAHASQK